MRDSKRMESAAVARIERSEIRGRRSLISLRSIRATASIWIGATLVVALFARRLGQRGDHKGRPYIILRFAFTMRILSDWLNAGD